MQNEPQRPLAFAHHQLNTLTKQNGIIIELWGCDNSRFGGGLARIIIPKKATFSTQKGKLVQRDWLILVEKGKAYIQYCRDRSLNSYELVIRQWSMIEEKSDFCITAEKSKFIFWIVTLTSFQNDILFKM